MRPEKPITLTGVVVTAPVCPKEAGPSASGSGRVAPSRQIGRIGSFSTGPLLDGPGVSRSRALSEQEAMFAKAARTADWRGSKVYAASFGSFGLMSRGAAWALDVATGSDAGSLSANLAKAAGMATALSMPLAHNMACTEVASRQFPFEGPPTLCVQPDPDNPIPMGNVVGEAFRPFIGYLAAGNTVANALAQGAGLVAAGSGNAQAGEHLERALNIVLPWVPGNLAAAQTARNIVSGQLALGFSLSEPIAGHGDGDKGGRLVVHQNAIERDNRVPELGHLTIEHEGVTYRLTVLDLPNGKDAVTVTALPQSPQPPEQSAASRAKALAQYFVPNHQTVTKTAALASTLAGIGGITLGITPQLRDGMIANGVDPQAAHELTKLTNYALANHLLGTDFMQKFQTFTEPAATWKDVAAKIGVASIPVFGGAIAAARRPAPNVPGLTEAQFEKLAKNKIKLMKRLEEFSRSLGSIAYINNKYSIDSKKIIHNGLRAENSIYSSSVIPMKF